MNEPCRRLSTLLAICLVLGGWACPSAAEPTQAGQRPETLPPAVQVVRVGPEPPTSFLERLQSWFVPRTVVTLSEAGSLSAEQVLASPSADGVQVWLDLRESTAAHAYFVVSSQPRPRFLIRDIPFEHGLDEIGLERLVQAIYSSTLAFWEGRAESPQTEIERRLGDPTPSTEDARGLPAPTAPVAGPGMAVSPSIPPLAAQAPALRPEPEPGAACHYFVGWGYGITSRGPERPAHGPALWGALLWGERRTTLGVWLSAQYLVPITAQAPGLELTLTGARVRIGPVLAHRLGGLFTGEAGGGIGGDVVRYETAADAGLRALPPTTEFRPVASLYAAGRLAFGGGHVAFGTDLHVQLQKTRYSVRTTSGPDYVLIPWRVQPGIFVLLCFEGTRP